MRLWSEELEAMRDETREAVASAAAAVAEMLGTDRPMPDDPIERAKLSREVFAQVYAGATSPDAQEREIAGRPCRMFVPDDTPRAVYLHFHGGGMILGAPEMNDIPNADLMKRFGVAVVSASYRLAPEHPYPAAPDDGFAVARWLLEHAEQELGTGRLLIGGESAGAYMSAMTLLRVRDELGAVDRFEGANLVFGVYDWGRSPSQRGIRPIDGPDIIEPEGIEFFSECYLPGRTDDERRDPAISPAFADLRGLPPALLSVGTADHLLDDTLMLASRLAAADNEVELFVAPELPHGFMASPCAMVDAWAKRMDDWFAEILAREPARART